MRLVKYILIGLSVAAALMLFFAGDAAVDALLTWAYALLGTAALTAVAFFVAHLVRDLRARDRRRPLRLLACFGGLIALGLACWLTSDARPAGKFTGTVALRLADTLLYTVYVLIAVAAVAAVYGAASRKK
ncbi:MAG: hypothetical protein LBH06_06430 [Rikenellaceae bacterium]|jgi:hypothetical protein|nr:hypothetical protein [Rikenellaceae bacterium]